MLRGDCSYQRRQDETLPEKDAAQKTQEIRFQKLRHGVPSNPPLYIRYFFPILVTIGIIGGIAAFWIPVETGWLRQSGLSGEAEQIHLRFAPTSFIYHWRYNIGFTSTKDCQGISFPQTFYNLRQLG